jgi:hypothetical protein
MNPSKTGVRGLTKMKLIRRDPSMGYLDSLLWVPKSQINVEGTKAALSFTVNDKKSLRFLTLYKETPHHLLVPREFWDPSTLSFPVVDCRPREFQHVDIRSKIVLDLKNPNKDTQTKAVQAMQAAHGGILQLACGLGKTVCALELVAREKVPAIIIVDNTHLLGQWKEAIDMFLDIPGGLGMIGDGQFDWKKNVVLATYQTLAQKAEEFPMEARKWFGLVIWDEAHHMAAPTWSKTADLFFGKRIGLTATPERVDGTHVIYDFHIGKVLYKDLTQELKPALFFYWTGMQVNQQDPYIRSRVCDINGELHVGKLSGYFGQWRDRLDMILEEVKTAERLGRRVMVLSYSIAELINLFLLWGGASGTHYTNLTYPTAKDVGETVEPVELDERTLRRLSTRRGQLFGMLKAQPNQPVVRQQLDEIAKRLKAHDVSKKCDLEYERKQRAILKEALKANVSNAGLMIGAIKREERMEMLRTKQITFAIMKYGREGLDEQSLDTIFVCEPISQKNGLQQLMGRALRPKAGKKAPVVVFFEDDIGPMIGMCQKLRRHLRSWPLEEGGPFTYEHIKHPNKRGPSTWITL